MSNLHRMMDVQVGLHADAATFLTAPSAYRRIRLVGGGESFLPRGMTPISRNDVVALNGQGFTDQRGPLDLAALAPVLKFRGVNDNSGAGVTASGWLNKMEQGEILTSFFGSLPVATSGSAPTVAASGHTTTLLNTATTVPVAGQILMFETSAGLRVRRVASVTNTTEANFDHPYTGTPVTASTIIRAATWLWDSSVRNHTHLGFLAEDRQQLTTFLGCAPDTLALSMDAGAQLRMTLGVMPTTATGAEAPATPSVTYPSSGEPILALNGELFIGGEAFIPTGMSFSLATGNVMRATPSSPHGVLGGVGEEKRGALQLSFTLRAGTSAARGEVQRNAGVETMRTILGITDGPQAISAGRNVFLSLGRGVGGAVGLSIPTANLAASMATDGGHTVFSCVATATSAASIGVL
jgi:hypothetical protein